MFVCFSVALKNISLPIESAFIRFTGSFQICNKLLKVLDWHSLKNLLKKPFTRSLSWPYGSDWQSLIRMPTTPTPYDIMQFLFQVAYKGSCVCAAATNWPPRVEKRIEAVVAAITPDTSLKAWAFGLDMYYLRNFVNVKHLYVYLSCSFISYITYNYYYNKYHKAEHTNIHVQTPRII